MSADDLTEEELALVRRYAKDFAKLDRPSASVLVFLRSVSWALILLYLFFRAGFYLVFERMPELAMRNVACGRSGCGTLEGSIAGLLFILSIALLYYLWKRWKFYQALVDLKAKYER